MSSTAPTVVIPKSGWLLFLDYVRRTENISYKEALKVASARWKQLTIEQRQTFNPATFPPPAKQPKYPINFVQTRGCKHGVLPAGEYYIGDLCYGMADEVYDVVWGNTFGYTSGLYETPSRSHIFAMGSTGGDGSFPGSDGNEYSVDAGIIGIMSTNLLKGTKEEFLSGSRFGGPPARIHTFEYPVTFQFDEQRLIFRFISDDKHLVIRDVSENVDD
jgi:hypothetical protein